MKYIFVILALASCQQIPGTTEYALRHRVEDAVKRQLKDPDSAQFSDMSWYTDRDLACGKVNAKNAYGGYTGPKEFAYFEGTALSLDWTRDPNQYLWAQHQCLVEHIGKLRREHPDVKFDDPGPFKGA